MIYLYSGSPGSGKSLHVARDIYYRLNKSKNSRNVIANFTINRKMIKSKKANFIYKDNSELTVQFLLDHALKNHKLGKENQTLVVVDECQVIWNSREWQSNHDRMEWIKFFTQHRKLGYNFIVISQNDRMIDRQIRSLFEYEIKHRKVNNFKIGKLLPFATFVAVSYWYGVNEKLGVEFFTYKKKWGKFYDSYGTFELDKNLMKLIKEENIELIPDAQEIKKVSKKISLKKLFNFKESYFPYAFLCFLLVLFIYFNF